MRRAAVVTLVVLAAVSAHAQSPRRALAAGTGEYLLADYRAAWPLLSLGLDPKTGSIDQSWQQGVERLADVLLVLRQDSLAAAWLRWAMRLAPDFYVEADVMPPAVVRAAAAARSFVEATPRDRFVAQVDFTWPAGFSAGAPGTIRLEPASVPITARIGADQFVRAGESRQLPPGSYDIVVSAPGYLPTRMTVEALPAVTTRVRVSLLPETAAVLSVAARPWGTLFVDQERIGFTDIAGHRIAPGRHVVRLQRDQRRFRDTVLVVADREQVRLRWVDRHDATGDAQVDSALEMLDAGDVERAAELLGRLLAARAEAGGAARAAALAHLAGAIWSLGARDSATHLLRAVVQCDPFYAPPSDLFNPELRAAYLRVRRETTAIRIRAPADTLLNPARDTLPIEIAVGRPGMVRLSLRLVQPRPRDSLVATLLVDSIATARVPAALSQGGAWPTGEYAIIGEVAPSEPGSSDLLQLRVERLPVDTIPQKALRPAIFRPETLSGGPTRRTILEGLGLGVLALAVPVALNDRSLSGHSVPPAAWAIAGSVSVTSIALRRSSTPLPENVRYNEVARIQWQTENRVIAARNTAILRAAPFRLRATREP